MGSGAACAIGACSVTCVLLFGLTPSIVWLVIGNAHKNDECLQNANFTPDLATWLIVNGSIGVVNVVAILIAMLSMVFFSEDKNVVGCCLSVPSIIWIVLASFFLLAWGGVGIAVLVKDEDCSDESSTLFNTVIAAVVLNLLQLCSNSSVAGSKSS